MKQAFRVMFACGLVLGLAGAPLFAEQTCKPVVGSFEASLVPQGTGHCPSPTQENPEPFCTAGRVWGGLQGEYEFVMTGATPAGAFGGGPTVLFFAGQSKVTLKSGDQVLGTDSGSLDLPPGLGGFASLITWTGGTGAMTGATGQIRLRGEFSPTEGTTSGDYLGTVCGGQ